MKTLLHISHFAGRTFAIWVIVFACLGFTFPATFSLIGPYIPFLLGIIMFGMGLTLSSEDFKELFRKPLYVLIGVLAQYTLMPLIAFYWPMGYICLLKSLSVSFSLAAVQAGLHPM